MRAALVTAELWLVLAVAAVPAYGADLSHIRVTGGDAVHRREVREVIRSLAPTRIIRVHLTRLLSPAAVGKFDAIEVMIRSGGTTEAMLLIGGYRDRTVRAGIAVPVLNAIVGRGDRRPRVGNELYGIPPPLSRTVATQRDARRLAARLRRIVARDGDRIERLRVRRPFGLAVDLVVRAGHPKTAFCSTVDVLQRATGLSVFPFRKFDAVRLAVIPGHRLESWGSFSFPRFGESGGPGSCVGEQAWLAWSASDIPAKTVDECLAIVGATSVNDPDPLAQQCVSAPTARWVRLAVTNHGGESVAARCSVNGATFVWRFPGALFVDPGATSTFEWMLQGAAPLGSRCIITRNLPT